MEDDHVGRAAGGNGRRILLEEQVPRNALRFEAGFRVRLGILRQEFREDSAVAAREAGPQLHRVIASAKGIDNRGRLRGGQTGVHGRLGGSGVGAGSGGIGGVRGQPGLRRHKRRVP